MISHVYSPPLPRRTSLPLVTSPPSPLPLLPRATVAAIKRHEQAADDGVPALPPPLNARVQLHRDEYAGGGEDGEPTRHVALGLLFSCVGAISAS